MSDLRAALDGVRTHNGEPVTVENLRWAATHEALCRSYIFDVLMGIADALEAGPPAEARVIPSRTSDPETSRKAEPGPLKAGTQRALLLDAFAKTGDYGATDEEAADLADGVPYRSEFAKRCSELREAGWITDTGRTRKGVAGHDRIVSIVTAAGHYQLDRLARS